MGVTPSLQPLSFAFVNCEIKQTPPLSLSSSLCLISLSLSQQLLAVITKLVVATKLAVACDGDLEHKKMGLRRWLNRFSVT